ncbi:MAG: hypothetical protein LBC41_05275 [Clostridiales bacterium]|nr:hypothetical protein [Clostridiales bacterium]
MSSPLSLLADPVPLFIVCGGALVSNLMAGGAKGLRAAARAFAPRPALDLAPSELAADMFMKSPSEMEREIQGVSSKFMRQALLAASELGPEALARTLDLEVEAQSASFEEDALAWEHAANAADAWGALGALAGFILALALRDEEVMRRVWIMFSLRCALWGLIFSRVALWPIAVRVRSSGARTLVSMRLVSEAVVSRASGETNESLNRIAERL